MQKPSKISHSSHDAEQQFIPCPLPRRLGAVFYDTLLLFAVLILAGGLYMWLLGEDATRPNHPLYTLYLMGVSFAFFGGFWMRGGQTLGMRAWGIRVLTLDGRPVPWPLAVIRFIAALFSWALAGLGFWCALLNKNRRTWHDQVSRTQLVRVRKG